jgi:2-desacetyl-2-hydroxyethyl bacteriochlorophyllide A dehydrogenase
MTSQPVADAPVGRVRAAVLATIPGLPVRGDVELPRPEPDEAVIRVEACGVCGTDLHIVAGSSYRPALPFVLGHEAVGIVESAPPGREDLIGARVAVSPFRGCGTCPRCSRGDVRLCDRGAVVSGVLGKWGGFATQMIARASQLVAVPDGLDPVEAAALVDSGTTAVHAVEVADLDRGDRVVVVGGGAIGRIVLDILPPVASVTVVQRSAAKRAAIAERHPAATVVADIVDAGAGHTVVIECSGASSVIEPSLASLVAGGRMILAGYAVATVDFARVARNELHIVGVRSGTTADLARVLDLARQGVIPPSSPAVYSLDEIEAAFLQLQSPDAPAKAVIVPDHVA